MKIGLKLKTKNYFSAFLILIFFLASAFASAEEPLVIIDNGGTEPAPSADANSPASQEPAASVDSGADDPAVLTSENNGDNNVEIVQNQENSPASDNPETIVSDQSNEQSAIGTTEQTENGAGTTEQSDEPIVLGLDQSFSNGANDSALGAETPEVPGPSEHWVSTGFVRDLAIARLSVLGLWPMNRSADPSVAGRDDGPDAGAQFLPSGHYATDKNLAICAIIADPADLAAASVSAEIFYPDNIVFGRAGLSGCGLKQGEAVLTRLEPVAGEDLACAKIREQNNNLPAWYNSPDGAWPYGYDTICGDSGYLASGQAAVFCGPASLAYDDPAGFYRVKIAAQNNGATVAADSRFEYLALTVFENDFAAVQYGPVKTNQWKIVLGDKLWGSGQPTARNIGNTNLRVKIWQNDFGLGRSESGWNIRYEARVGESGAFTVYEPEKSGLLPAILAVGQSSSLDFGVLIEKFPPAGTAFSGQMLLTAEAAPFPVCEPN